MVSMLDFYSDDQSSRAKNIALKDQKEAGVGPYLINKHNIRRYTFYLIRDWWFP